MKTELSINTDLICSNHVIKVQFGELCYSINCQDENILAAMRKSYKLFLSDKPADVNIMLETGNRLDPVIVKKILAEKEAFLPVVPSKGSNQALEIRFNAAKNTFQVSADRCLFHPLLKLKPMNRLFRIVYYTVSPLKYGGRPAGMLVHSCGILRNGEVMLFAGPSEIGKSTIGHLCSDDYGLPLNDEMVLLSWLTPTQHSLFVQSVPILGELPFRLNTSATLACVMMLKQSQRTAVRRLDRKEAYLRFMYQIINPARLNQADKSGIFTLIADFTNEVTKVIPFYELEFTRDRHLLWEVETKLTKLNKKEVEYGRGTANAS